MAVNQWSKCYFAVCLLMAGCIAYTIQIHAYFNSDVASLLFDTELFLNGGTYVKDFFETNPPMIFILYTPIVLFQKWTQLDIRYVTYGYIILLAWISIFVCNYLLKKIITKNDDYLRYGMIAALTFDYLFMTLVDFGQREHILLMFIMPYFFSVVLRAQHKSIPSFTALLIGVMAGLVFSLKPFFLAPLVLLELYLMIVRKNLFAWFRIETLMIACVIMFYLAFVYVFYHVYLDTMLPLLSHWYFVSTKETWLIIFSREKVLFCTMMVAYYFLFYKKDYFRELTQVLLLALVGLFMAFLIPRSAWGYHVLPCFAVGVVLCVIYVYQKWSREINQHLLAKREILFIFVASFAMPIVVYLYEVRAVLSAAYADPYIKLYNAIKPIPHQSVYCFSSHTTGLCFPFVSLNNMTFAGRFPLLWWLRGILLAENQHLPPSYLLKEKKYFIDALTNDLNHYKPQLIIADKVDEAHFLPHGQTHSAYFSEDAAFRGAWAHYKKFRDVGRFALYQRVS